MAMVDALPVPDSRQKVDELFLYWLSDPSRQDVLRSELSKVCRSDLTEGDSGFLAQTALAGIQRPISPGYRTTSPPLYLANSPKSPRTQRRAKSPRRQVRSSSVEQTVEDTDSPTSTSLSLREPGKRPLEVENQNGEPGGVCGAARAKVEEATVQRNLSRRQEKVSHSPSRCVSSEAIPPFFFPNGQPKVGEDLERQLRDAAQAFQLQPSGEMTQSDFHLVVKAMKLPLYWKGPLFHACVGRTTDSHVTFPILQKTWQKITQHCHDDASRFVKMLSRSGRNYLMEADFEPLIQDIVDNHPGLAFLSSAPEFHARYIETVIGRIFYVVSRGWNGRITASELRRSNFLQTLERLETEQDINQVTEYFSYEHFYVIYCKFWELDTDHDLVIDAQDLSRHADHALTPSIIQRIMSGVVSRDVNAPAGKLSYRDFIWFLMSEEDKTSQRSIEYWFRCLDTDGDGFLSLYELEMFYSEVLQRLQELSIECLSVENTVCQVLDMVNPRGKDIISLGDLKTCKLTPIFLNMFVNVEKYLEYEQRDPITCSKEEGESYSEWNQYAAEQYDILLAEEAYENENNNFEEMDNTELGEEEKEMLALLK